MAGVQFGILITVVVAATVVLGRVVYRLGRDISGLAQRVSRLEGEHHTDGYPR